MNCEHSYRYSGYLDPIYPVALPENGEPPQFFPHLVFGLLSALGLGVFAWLA